MFLSKRKIQNFYLALLIAITGISYGIEEPRPEDCGRYTTSHFDIKHREHQGVGFDQGYSTASVLFISEIGNGFTPFFDGRLHVFNNGYLASNLGVGARFGSPLSSWVVGVNGYFDYRNYKSLSTYQASGGLELLHRDFDIRVNGYYPFSGKTQEEEIFARGFTGNSLLVDQKIRYALPMVEGELGFPVGGPFRQVDFYMALGYYYLFKQTTPIGFSVGHVSGGKARVEATAFKYLTLGAEYTYDLEFKGRINGYIGVSIPLGPRSIQKSKVKRYPYEPSYCDKYVSWLDFKTRPVVHNEIIPFVNKNHGYPHQSNGVPFNIIFVNNLGADHPLGAVSGPGGDGTFEDPYTTLKLAEINSGPNDIIYVFYGDGTSANYNEGYICQTRQTLTSSSQELTLGSIIIPPLTPGLSPLLTNTASPVILCVNSRSVDVDGFRIEGNGASAIYAATSSLNIKNCHVTAASSQPALEIIDPFGINNIQGNVFTSGGGIVNLAALTQNISSNRNNLNVQDNTFNSTGAQTALLVTGINKSINIQNNNFTNATSGGTAIAYNSTGGGENQTTCSYNQFNSAFDNYIAITETNVTAQSIDVKNNTSTVASNLEGISIVSGSISDIEVQGNSFVVTDVGISVSTTGMTDIDISNNTLTCAANASGIGIASTNASEIAVRDNTITYTAVPGTGIGIDIDHSPIGTMFTSIVDVEGNLVYSVDGVNTYSITNGGDGRMNLTVNSNQADSSSPHGSILVTNASTEPLSAGFSGNFINNTSAKAIDLNEASTGVFQALTSTPTSGSGISLANNNATVTPTGTIVYAPLATPCPPFQGVFVNNNSSTSIYASDGSFAYPYTNLTTAGTASSNGDIIYLYEGISRSGLNNSTYTPIVLKPSQTLHGAQLPITVKGVIIPPSSTGMPRIFLDTATTPAISYVAATSSPIIVRGIEATNYSFPVLNFVSNSVGDFIIDQCVFTSYYGAPSPVACVTIDYTGSNSYTGVFTNNVVSSIGNAAILNHGIEITTNGISSLLMQNNEVTSIHGTPCALVLNNATVDFTIDSNNFSKPTIEDYSLAIGSSNGTTMTGNIAVTNNSITSQGTLTLALNLNVSHGGTSNLTLNNNALVGDSSAAVISIFNGQNGPPSNPSNGQLVINAFGNFIKEVTNPDALGTFGITSANGVICVDKFAENMAGEYLFYAEPTRILNIWGTQDDFEANNNPAGIYTLTNVTFVDTGTTCPTINP